MKTLKEYNKDFSALNATQQRFIRTVFIIKILVLLFAGAVFLYVWKTFFS